MDRKDTETPNPEFEAKRDKIAASNFYTIRAKYYDLFKIKGDFGDEDMIKKIFSDLELLEKVASGGVEKKENIHCLHGKGSKCQECNLEKAKILGFNQAINACNAHLAGKIKGIRNIIIDFALSIDDPDTGKGIGINQCEKLNQLITTHLTGGGE